MAGLDHYAPNGHDTGSTTARSVDEVALIRDTISHYAPVLIASLSIPNSSHRGPEKIRGAIAGAKAPAMTEAHCPFNPIFLGFSCSIRVGRHGGLPRSLSS